jgi:hypothetical protein
MADEEMEELGREIRRQEESVRDSSIQYGESKKELKMAQRRFALQRSLTNAHYKAWFEARRRLTALRAKRSALPSVRRKYAREHMGDALASIGL